MGRNDDDDDDGDNNDDACCPLSRTDADIDDASDALLLSLSMLVRLLIPMFLLRYLVSSSLSSLSSSPSATTKSISSNSPSPSSTPKYAASGESWASLPASDSGLMGLNTRGANKSICSLATLNACSIALCLISSDQKHLSRIKLNLSCPLGPHTCPPSASSDFTYISRDRSARAAT